MGRREGAPPMPRIVCTCLCAVVALAALLTAPLVHPTPALAASGTLTVEAPLLEAPTEGAAAVALLPQGTVVSIDGPPVDGFYPVTAGDVSGWLRGETLAVAKEVAAGGGEEATVDPAANADLAPDTAPADEVPIDPAAVNAVPAAPAPDAMSAPVESTGVAPAPAPNAPPVPVSDPGPTGPAHVAAEAPILAGPGPEYGLIITAPLGSMVEQTGHQIGGYVTVRVAEVTGWAPLDHLAPPPAPGEESTIPAATPVG